MAVIGQYQSFELDIQFDSRHDALMKMLFPHHHEDHSHSDGHHHHGGPNNHGRAFAIAIALNTAFVVVELAYGFISFLRVACRRLNSYP